MTTPTAPLMKASAVAEQLGLSLRKVYDLARTGELPSYRFGDAVRFDPSDVSNYFTSCRSTTTRSASAGTTSFPASLADSDDALQSYFRKRGLPLRQKPTAKPKTAGSQPLRLVQSESSR